MSSDNEQRAAREAYILSSVPPEERPFPGWRPGGLEMLFFGSTSTEIARKKGFTGLVGIDHDDFSSTFSRLMREAEDIAEKDFKLEMEGLTPEEIYDKTKGEGLEIMVEQRRFAVDNSVLFERIRKAQEIALSHNLFRPNV